MKNVLDKISEYEKQILAEQEFIVAPNSYIYDMTDIEVEGEITEYLRAITFRNTELLVDKKAKIDAKKQELASLSPITLTPVVVEESIESEPAKEEQTPKKDLTNYIKTLEEALFEDSTRTLLQTATSEDIIRLKLYFLRKITMLKKQIRQLIMLNPTNGVSELQDKIVQSELTIEFLTQLQKEEQVVEEENNELSNIILVPDLRAKNSYLFGDILRYTESRKEIKTALDKILDGYFLRTKDTKMIESYREQKLYEYKHPNGIRVLYIVNNGYIFICSMFYKDKQKSIRISSYYEEAVNRYLSSFEYMRDNISNPDFYIEQDEYIAKINAVLEQGISLSKKVGE